MNFIPACRVRGKQTGRELYDRGYCTLRPIRAWITSPTIDPEDAFAITFRIDSAPRRSCLTALQELASAPSCLRMDSVGYAGVTYYCLRSVFDKEQERDGDNLLDELCSDPEFASQAWTKDDFCIIWYWVQRASAVFPCEGGRLEASFTFDVTTSAGRIRKFNTNSADAVVCGKAHVRLKKMEAAGDSITEEVKLMRNTSPVYWREVFQDRRQYCGVPNDEAGALLERLRKRVRHNHEPVWEAYRQFLSNSGIFGGSFREVFGFVRRLLGFLSVKFPDKEMKQRALNLRLPTGCRPTERFDTRMAGKGSGDTRKASLSLSFSFSSSI